MTPFVTLLFLLSAMGGAWPAVSQTSDPTELGCYDWGGSSRDRVLDRVPVPVLVLEGEAGWLSCPPNVYNHSSAQNLLWYRVPEGQDQPEGQDLEQPVPYSSRISRDGERLVLSPALPEDSGLYICTLRNQSSSSKMSMRLKVRRRDQVSPLADCVPPVAAAPVQVTVPFQQGQTLECPDLQDAARMGDVPPRVSWYHTRPELSICKGEFLSHDVEQQGPHLRIWVMLVPYQGFYVCTVQFQRRNRALNFTRSINVTAIQNQYHNLSKDPVILRPHGDQVFSVRRDGDAQLVCQALFPVIQSDSSWDMWWTVDGKRPGDRTVVSYDYGDVERESVLLIRDVQPEDLRREINCSVRNGRGFQSRRLQLQEEVSLPSVQLGCGLGVTLVLMLLLFVVYHVFWLELLLLYRSWFGTDERHTDDKEYDVYISYARNSEEEQFVLSTLRSVLENELGYSVCIFDRDSLPGGTITDETLSFVARSRRLLVVVSPDYASQGSQALLELKAGIDGMALGGHLRVILVQYKPVQRQGWVRELRSARVALALVQWKGNKSRELSSHFWKKLRVELPVRRVNGAVQETALMRLMSQNSTNSQTGLISSMVKDPEKAFNSAA
ncbi:interleukin-1 receptor accessory protein isoform X2 [Cololabis saira]|uniref:interleukin-1 receptor accessory protein isoform X2 n=1 Tax=Cololabis saira TaxID=129043 RepID=UPI002AD52FA2|nr:interleukin-1 receptor accessory protein isoform X2 [Cololabis saira]